MYIYLKYSMNGYFNHNVYSGRKNAFYKLSLINHFIFSLQRFEFIKNFGIIGIKTD